MPPSLGRVDHLNGLKEMWLLVARSPVGTGVIARKNEEEAEAEESKLKLKSPSNKRKQNIPLHLGIFF